MPVDSRIILDYFQNIAKAPQKMKEAARALQVDSEEYPRFRKLVKSLIDQGELVNLNRARIGVPQKLNVIVGKLALTRSGVGFVIREGEETDIMIPAMNLFTALDGDKVMVRLLGKGHDRPTGEIVRVVERSPRKIVGLFRKVRQFNYVAPDNPKIHRDLSISPDNINGAEDGDKVVVELVAWDDPHTNPEGRIVERLGKPGEPGVDMLTVIRTFSLPEQFPSEVLNQAEQAAARLSEVDLSLRLDQTNECVYTIDPADAKDHDDAVSVTATSKGYTLAVHIADVSYFVEEGTALDKEALQRGNSVYLPGMVIPMLPESLSNDVCSLRPNRKRLTHSVFMEFDKQGTMLSWKLADTVIDSKAKLSYEQVQAFFDSTPEADKIDTKVAENLTTARRLALILSERRFAEGSLDFDLPESKIILGKNGEVLELGSRVRLEAHRLIEEFMLAANKAIALEAFRAGVPFLYRVHDKPDLETLEGFSEMMSRLGKSFPISPTMRPIQFSRFLRQVAGSPEADFINELMLRAMKKAVYQRENIGHFGLAFSHYSHFTSPIRRYPDLVVPRLLRKLRQGTYKPQAAGKYNSILDSIGRHCSDTERTAEAAERQAVRVKQIAYMANHLGDQYHGVISGVMPYGFFVRLDNLGVEGLVRVSTIDDDYYFHDEKHHRLVGRRSKTSYRMGDAVYVGVLRVDSTRNELDLFVVGSRADKSSTLVTARPIGTKSRNNLRKDHPARKRKQKRNR